MTCPWCHRDTPDCPYGTSAKCMKCGHWFLVMNKNDEPTLQVCKQCGRRMHGEHMVNGTCLICVVPKP